MTTAADAWRTWLTAHGLPTDPGLGAPNAVLQSWINAHVAALGAAVPVDVRANVFHSTAALTTSGPITTDTTAADRAWFAWLAASAAGATKDPDALEAVQHFVSWLGTLPSLADATVRDQLERWSATFSHITQAVQDTGKHGLDNLIDSLGKFLDTVTKPGGDFLGGIKDLLWGILGLGAIFLGLGALVLLSGGGQAYLMSVGVGFGSAIGSLGAGYGGATLLLGRGVGLGIARWPEALRFLPMVA